MDTEEEQLEELKRWWREHGRTVIAGVVLGLGTVGGWSWWRNHVTTQAEAASLHYEQLVNTAAVPDHDAAVAQADAIIAQDPDSGYAALAALVGAHAAWRKGDAATARRMLEWAVEHGEEFAVEVYHGCGSRACWPARAATTRPWQVWTRSPGTRSRRWSRRPGATCWRRRTIATAPLGVATQAMVASR